MRNRTTDTRVIFLVHPAAETNGIGRCKSSSYTPDMVNKNVTHTMVVRLVLAVQMCLDSLDFRKKKFPGKV